MSKPSNVAAFLSFGTSQFDPSLIFVMGGAVLIAMPFFTAVFHGSLPTRPVCKGTFPLSSKVVDGRLLLGGALFGIGWGLGALCPGPAIVALASGSKQVFVFVVAMLTGFWLVG